MQHIAIIGGGLSGAVSAINLLNAYRNDIVISIFEKDASQFLRGPAYASQLPHQLLNVTASAMSLFADEPDHFMKWLDESYPDHGYNPSDFVPRKLFGAYVASTFESCRDRSNVLINTEFTAVNHIAAGPDGYELSTADGRRILAHQVILGLGNMPPQRLPGLAAAAKEHPNIINNPWKGDFLKEINTDEDVLLVGTGLTMVDILLSLRKQGHRGKIVITSRRGYLPHAHDNAPVYTPKSFPKSFNTPELLLWLKQEIAFASEKGLSWISVLNALRDVTPDIWIKIPLEEKKRFIRHLKAIWEVHRHRIPSESLLQINKLIAGGQVIKLCGRIRKIEEVSGLLHTTLETKVTRNKIEIASHKIINCTGPSLDMQYSGNPLISSLISSGLVTPDETNMGLVVCPGINNIYLVGPLNKGLLWECTALREIRQHAAAAADSILQSRRTIQKAPVSA